MKVAAYARVSSDSQDVDLSISAQLRAMRDYAEKHKYTIVREFVDEAESGRTASRPAFKEMIALAKTRQPPFQAVLVWKLNRFSRNRIDSITYKALLKKKGIKVISTTEPLDDNPSGKLLEGVIESIDEYQSASIGQDVKRGMRESAQRGFFVGSRPPYGLSRKAVKDSNKIRYKLEPEKNNPIPVQVVRRMFDMAQHDIGCKEIAKTLNKEGLRTGDGQRWGRTTVHKILTNEAYCGSLVWGGRPGHSAIHSGDAPVRVENAWEAIIGKDIFIQVQAKMFLKRPAMIHPRTLPSAYLLSGLLFCSCGHAMIGRSAKYHRYYYYICNGGYKQGRDACNTRPLPKEKLEHQVVEKIKFNVLNQEWLEELVKLVNEELDSTHGLLKDRLDAIEAEMNDVRIRLDKLYDTLETGKLNMDDLAPRIKELRARQDAQSKARILIEAEMAAQGINYVDAGNIKTYAEDLKNLLGEGDISESKAFLRSFIKRIVINGEKAAIEYNLPVPPDEKKRQSIGVLPIDTPGGPGVSTGNTFMVTFRL